MIDSTTAWLFVLASAAIVIVPGPTVTLIVANSLRAGAKAGLFNVLGTQIGLMAMLLLLAFGFSVVVGQLSIVFDVIRVLGALYLIWLGYKLFCAKGMSFSAGISAQANQSNASYMWQGFLVIWANPKALFFFGSFIPQFVNKAEPTMAQVLVLGVIFMIVGAIFDSAYAVVAGSGGALMKQSQLKWIERVSGVCLMGGGVWLLFSRSA